MADDNSKQDDKLIKVDRVAYNNNEFETKYHFRKLRSENVLKNDAHYCHKNYKPTPSCMKSYFLDRFPIIKWMKNYNFKVSSGKY